MFFPDGVAFDGKRFNYLAPSERAASHGTCPFGRPPRAGRGRVLMKEWTVRSASAKATADTTWLANRSSTPTLTSVSEGW
jgi:hypothetical protein